MARKSKQTSGPGPGEHGGPAAEGLSYQAGSATREDDGPRNTKAHDARKAARAADERRRRALSGPDALAERQRREQGGDRAGQGGR